MPVLIRTATTHGSATVGQLDSPRDSYDIQSHQAGVTTPEEVRFVLASNISCVLPLNLFIPNPHGVQ
uniref:3-keto-5-aminohexanoate cleavage protein n=1 Tax=Heterorhabditis bacteriophora TaxID=37862 RepID=A0A1I7WEG8_HETBA